MLAFLILALLGLAGSVAVHARSFVADTGIGQAAFIAMFAGVFVVFVPAIAAAPPRDDPQRKGGKAGEIWDVLPRPLRWLGGTVFAYAIINFAIGVFLLGGGYIYEREGVFYERGDPNVRLDPAEGRRRLDLHEVRQSRLFSGHALVFYGGSAAMLWAGRRRSMRREAEHRVAGAFGPERVPGAWRRPTPQVHAGVGIFLSTAGFLGGAMAGAILVVPFVHSIPVVGCFLTPIIFFGGATIGLVIPPRLWNAFAPARCPRCGGRASRGGDAPDGRAQYACRDCGHVEPLGFRGGVGGASAD